MLTLDLRTASAPPLLDELSARQPALARYGMVLLFLGVAALVMQAADPRTLAGGVNIWVKPAKFFLSVGIFALTLTWFFGYVRLERRRSPLMRRTVAVLMAAGTFELVYISWQAALAQESHFNASTTFHSVMYALMGLGAVALSTTSLALAWEIARRPVDGLQRSFVAAVVAGLVLTFLLGGVLGGYMSSQAGHAVGTEGGHLPIVGWNRSGGDLRAAHFLGMHAQQALPVLAALVAPLAARTRWTVVVLGAGAYVTLTLALFFQAVAGRPLL